MSGQSLCKEAVKRNRFAIALSLMFVVHSPSVLADEHAQSSGVSNATSHDSGNHSGNQGRPATKVMGFTMKDDAFDFPAWPIKKAAAKDLSPPPPIGPYMSTALNNEQAGQPRFGNMMSIPVPDFDEMSMTTYSPDLPWPDDNNVNRWAPDKGYTFVAPTVRPSQPSFNQGVNQGNRYQRNANAARMNPQNKQSHYSRPPMPVPMYNGMMNNRPMNNMPVRRAPNTNYSGANYYASGNQVRRNPPMQQRNLPVNQAVNQPVNQPVNQYMGNRNYPNAMGRYPQVNTGYNRSAYRATPPPKMMPSPGNHR